MTYQLTVAAGKSSTVAPNGIRYNAGATFVLSDTEYAQLSATAIANDFTGITYLGDQVTYQATLKSTVSNVVLPNGLRYGPSAVAILSDAEYAQLSPTSLSALFSSVTAMGTNNGTVTGVSVASANGFSGTVANPSTTPAITLGTTVSGVLKGNGSAVSAAVAGTDYVAPSAIGAANGVAGLNSGGQVPVAQGGTAAASAAQNAVFAGPSTGGAGAPSFRALAVADVPTLNQNTTGTAAGLSSPLAIGSGGTGQTSQQAALNALAGAQTSGSYLRGNGSNVAMSAIQAADVPTLNQNTSGTAAGLSSTLGLGSGGTGQTSAAAAFNALSPMTTLGDTLYGGAAGAATRLAGNTTATKKFLTQTGTGSVSAAPAYSTIATTDLPSTAASANFKPSAPTGSISTTLVMCGLGSSSGQATPVVYTPVGTGKVLVLVTGYVSVLSALVAPTVGCRYGTGTAPTGTLSATVTNSGGNALFTVAGSAYSLNQQLVLTATAAPTNFTSGTTYFVVNPSGTTFNLATSANGTAIAFSTAGTAVTVAPVATGTRFGAGIDVQPKPQVAGNPPQAAFAFTDILSLTPSTQAWIDLVQLTANAADEVTITGVSVSLMELLF